MGAFENVEDVQQVIHIIDGLLALNPKKRTPAKTILQDKVFEQVPVPTPVLFTIEKSLATLKIQ